MFLLKKMCRNTKKPTYPCLGHHQHHLKNWNKRGIRFKGKISTQPHILIIHAFSFAIQTLFVFGTRLVYTGLCGNLSSNSSCLKTYLSEYVLTVVQSSMSFHLLWSTFAPLTKPCMSPQPEICSGVTSSDIIIYITSDEPEHNVKQIIFSYMLGHLVSMAAPFLSP